VWTWGSEEVVIHRAADGGQPCQALYQDEDPGMHSMELTGCTGRSV
jgi:hypothetical protein